MSKKTVRPKYPRELTEKQRSEIIGGIECEGFAYYFLEYSMRGRCLADS